jgi:repressor LexA
MAPNRKRRGRPQEDQITDAQRKTLKEVRDFIAHRKYPPTMKELGELLGVTAASAHQQVKQLERKGYVAREPRKARSLAVLREPQQQLAELVPVPLVGVVKAGPAMLAEENVLGDVMVDGSVAGRGRCFALRVSGDSMLDAGMAEGDIIIVRQQQVAESGEIVVALMGDESTVKRLSIRGDRIELRPENNENKQYHPTVIGPDDEFSILGKVVAVRRSGDPPET